MVFANDFLLNSFQLKTAFSQVIPIRTIDIKSGSKFGTTATPTIPKRKIASEVTEILYMDNCFDKVNGNVGQSFF